MEGLGMLQAKEKEALDKSERLAEEGDVDGSMLFANQVLHCASAAVYMWVSGLEGTPTPATERVPRAGVQAEAFQRQWKDLHTSFTQPERTMTVCEVCGVFINSTDNEQRRKVDVRPTAALLCHLSLTLMMPC